MRKIIYNLLFLLVSQITVAQTTTIVKSGNYTITGTENLSATQSITLLPNTWIKSGANFTAKIVEGPEQTTATDNYTSFSFSDENYVFTRVFQKGMTSFNASTAKEGDVLESIAYFDGLGRPMQSIGIKSAPNKEDIITHVGYDDYGRQDKDWLPYYEPSGTLGTYRGDKATATQQYYRTNYAEDFPGITTNAPINAYSQKEFEASPLNRVLKQGAPGKDWKLGEGNEIEFDYKTNTANEVREFLVSLSYAGDFYIPQLSNNGYYSANELYKTITKDENHSSGTNHTTEEFTNKQGRVVLKRTYNNGAHDTYYVYDDYGNLTYVLPPKVTTADVSTTELNELCYQYKYDKRNRLVEKKIPGKVWEPIVYNKLDLPILSQGGANLGSNEWLFTKYDAFGRVAYTGLYKFNASFTVPRPAVQQAANSNAITVQYEQVQGTSRNIANTNLYYSNSSFPKTDISKIYTINYYDTYVDTDGLSVPNTVYGQAKATNTKGLPTVSKVRVLDQNKWITTITGYDSKGRAIYVATKNTYLNTTYIVESKLDFAGKVLETKTTHKKTGKTDIVSVDTFTYDHEGRLLRQKQKINNQAKETIADNSYDNLGQLVQKKVGGNLQTVDYKYNIRGWLKQINNPASLGTDLFAFKISYNEGTNALFNGNISSTQWRTANTDSSLKSYNYTYDALNRITKGIDNTGKYNLEHITYDKNGNIMSLTRDGWQDSSNYTHMDVLNYDYFNSETSNKLYKVADTGNDTHGFKDSAVNDQDYWYDANGNMTRDDNKGITSISYNYLNLPTSVALDNSEGNGTISYIYDATGVKQRKVVSTGATTDYAGNYVYENNDLQFFNYAEGYVNAAGSSYEYIYQYKDHLGNVRLTYADSDNNGSVDPNTETISERSYYPFGMTHRGYNNVVSSKANSQAEKYQFNGKELSEELGLDWYDFGARNYDASLGRWMNLDPLAEKYYSYSPYVYTANNPIYFIDPDGKQIDISYIYEQDEDGKDVLDKNGNRILTGVNITITGKLINFSDNDVNMADALSEINSYLEETYSGTFNGVEVKTTANFTSVESMEDVSESDHLLVLSEPGKKNPDASGAANSFGPSKVAFLDADYFTGWFDTNFGKTGKRTVTHELGHNFGLKHTRNRGNIMVSGGSGNDFTLSQLGTIIQNYEESNQALNYGADGLPNMGVLQNQGIFNMTNTQGRNKKVNKTEYFKKVMGIKK